MKKRFLTCGLLFSSILLYSNGTTAYADDATSNANTTVSAGDGTGALIDSNVKPATNSSGSLTIDAVSSFNFGTIKVGVTSKTAETTNGEKLGVQVRDVRGTGAGWALNVKVGTFTNTTDSTKTLSASVSIPKGTVSNGVDSTQGVVAKAVVLNQSYANIMNAPKDTGMGRWLDAFESTTDKVTLQNIAQNAYTGSYTATMNWQLVDAPS
ncbi:WxL domain-containing protein [Enterococcus ureasiticus]|uniref:WxL domain-containing protein n=1 Tax=Enterococcus ureasiticus TaxID=903984 RepID=UPI001A8DC560|nr:WxL domain-containing protein [Enterococcus ureasiticus]MBO0473621.1 WxL domain-containing protein [Enterococcus ureasiticus]